LCRVCLLRKQKRHFRATKLLPCPVAKSICGRPKILDESSIRSRCGVERTIYQFLHCMDNKFQNMIHPCWATDRAVIVFGQRLSMKVHDVHQRSQGQREGILKKNVRHAQQKWRNRRPKKFLRRFFFTAQKLPQPQSTHRHKSTPRAELIRSH